jgi:hydroxypyruvate isomerase
MPEFSRRQFLAKSSAAAAAMSTIQCSGAGTSTSSTPGKTPHTKFAINVEIWWKDMPLLDRIKKAADLGFPAIEFWPYEEKDLEAIRKTCDTAGTQVAQFTAWGFDPGMNNPKNHALVEQKIEEACKAANLVGAPMMCVVGGDDQPGMTQPEMHQNIITALKIVAPIAESYDVMLILEPMNIRVDHAGHCLYGSQPAVAICDEVNSPKVKINWDLYHMHITEGDLCGHIHEGWHQVGYFQLADHPGRKEPGTGEIHYPRVLKEIYELGYRGFVGLECWPIEDELTAAHRVAAADQW